MTLPGLSELLAQISWHSFEWETSQFEVSSLSKHFRKGNRAESIPVIVNIC